MSLSALSVCFCLVESYHVGSLALRSLMLTISQLLRMIIDCLCLKSEFKSAVSAKIRIWCKFSQCWPDFVKWYVAIMNADHQVCGTFSIGGKCFSLCQLLQMCSDQRLSTGWCYCTMWLLLGKVGKEVELYSNVNNSLETTNLRFRLIVLPHESSSSLLGVLYFYFLCGKIHLPGSSKTEIHEYYQR